MDLLFAATTPPEATCEAMSNSFVPGVWDYFKEVCCAAYSMPKVCPSSVAITQMKEEVKNEGVFNVMI